MRAIKKMYFLFNLSHYVKSYGHFYQILFFFYYACSPNMVMSRDQRSKFQQNFYFVLILHLISGKVTKFLVEKPKTSRGVETLLLPPPPSAFGLTAGKIVLVTVSGHVFQLDALGNLLTFR